MRLTLLIGFASYVALAVAPTASAQTAVSPAPTLVVMITVDQFRGDYLDRYAGQFTGGLARLLRRGAVFTNAYQDHATTETAPGHASILSGRFPRSTGIVMNSLGVNDPKTPLVTGSGGGASPARFRGTAFFDWLAARDARSRALSISRKDRGAILPIGRAKQSVFWYTPEGAFTTSTYYADTLPSWLTHFNAQHLAQRYAGHAWTLLRPNNAYTEPDSVVYESGGSDFLFPHQISADSTAAAASLGNYPWMDELTLAGAFAGVRAMHLGTGPATDLLAVSLSTTDAIGHRYGPDSREIHDQVLRVDQMLGQFLDSLYTLCDSTRIVIALSADHGVTPFPELTVERTHQIVQHVSLTNIAGEFQDTLAHHGIPAAAFSFEESMLFVDRTAFDAHQVNMDSVVAAFAAAVRRRPGVARADELRMLRQGDTTDVITRRWIHAIPPDMPVALVVTLAPGNTWGSGTSAQHGQPSDLDAHVPLIFYGAGVVPGRHTEFVRTVDIAPTLAALIGVPPTEALDGRPLHAVLQQH